MPATQNATMRMRIIRVHSGSRSRYERNRCGLNWGNVDAIAGRVFALSSSLSCHRLCAIHYQASTEIRERRGWGSRKERRIEEGEDDEEEAAEGAMGRCAIDCLGKPPYCLPQSDLTGVRTDVTLVLSLPYFVQHRFCQLLPTNSTHTMLPR